MSVLTCIYGKYDPTIRPRVKSDALLASNITPRINSQNESSLVQVRNAGMSQMKFIQLQKALGKIDIASYAIEKDKVG